MTKFLLLLLVIIPAVCAAQGTVEVQPVLSADYSVLIKAVPATKAAPNDSAVNITSTGLTLKKYFNKYMPVKSVSIQSKQVNIYTDIRSRMTIGINYTAGITFSKANNPVELQHEYVQGRSQSGQLVWRGPETGEIFSYGPAVNTLEYDGAAYPYDASGRLVAKGTGSGLAAKAYDNNILRTGRAFSNDLKAFGHVIRTGKENWNFNIRFNRNDERYYVAENKNSTTAFSAGAGTVIKKINVSASYSYLNDDYASDNSHGFLNRAYQNSLLTPISFSNDAGITIGNMQRSYSPISDNPLFLLRNSGNSFSRHQNNAALTFDKKYGSVTYSLLQSFERQQEFTLEGYKRGSADFPAGIAAGIARQSSSYYLKGNAAYNINNDNHWKWRSSLSVNYIFSDKHAGINYNAAKSYAYQRSSHDISFNFFNAYSYSNVEAGINAGNKFYFSNTAASAAFFLPYIDAYIQARPAQSPFIFKLASSFNRSKSEPAINQSYAQSNLMHYSAQDALKYFPNSEVAGYKGPAAVDNREATARLELSYKQRLALNAEVFVKNNRGVAFPVLTAGDPVLKNIANTQLKGIEVSLFKYPAYLNKPKISLSNRLSFTAYTNTVTQVKDGYNFTPIAGFSNVYKAIVQGMTPGVIVGNAYLRDNNNNMVIGADGFPLTDPNVKVIGDPAPDFIMKLSNIVNYKKWTLNMDLEWQKGGDIWNGTQAALDYYGRSAASGWLRNTTNYTFAGVLEDGKPNTKPVSFYDPSLPVQDNRWVRYGATGVAEEYIQKADHLKLNALSLSYTQKFKKYIRQASLSASVNNVILWTAYKGTGTDQPLYGQSNAAGLDYFNLPSTKNYGLTLSLQF